jgi:hypothetical protein
VARQRQGERLLFYLILVVVLGGCAASAVPSPTPNAKATTTRSPAPTVQVVGSAAQVPEPNGTDDTANIQAALDACLSYGTSCTVELQAGTYRTRQLVAYGFRGTFKGAGQDRTIIEALPTLPVTAPDFFFSGECAPNLTDCLWPSLIIFVDGVIEVSDLAIHVAATDGRATAPYLIGGSSATSLVDALRFMGQHHTDVTIDRIAVEGRHDKAGTSINGFNLVNGILFAGELPRSSTPFDYYTLSGSLYVRASSFTTMDDGVAADGFLDSVTGFIGGSPSSGNRFVDVNAGIGLQPAQSSVFDISYNTSSAINYDYWMGPWQPAFVPSSPSQYRIHDNAFSAAGMFLQDDATHRWIAATISNNTVTVQAPHAEGIAVHDSTGTKISANAITGKLGRDAIGLYGVTNGSVTDNTVSGFTLDPGSGKAQIYLDSAAVKNTIVCYGPSDTVLDQGAGNAVTGCHR